MQYVTDAVRVKRLNLAMNAAIRGIFRDATIPLTLTRDLGGRDLFEILEDCEHMFELFYPGRDDAVEIKLMEYREQLSRLWAVGHALLKAEQQRSSTGQTDLDYARIREDVGAITIPGIDPVKKFLMSLIPDNGEPEQVPKSEPSFGPMNTETTSQKPEIAKCIRELVWDAPGRQFDMPQVHEVLVEFKPRPVPGRDGFIDISLKSFAVRKGCFVSRVRSELAALVKLPAISMMHNGFQPMREDSFFARLHDSNHAVVSYYPGVAYTLPANLPAGVFHTESKIYLPDDMTKEQVNEAVQFFLTDLHPEAVEVSHIRK